MYDFIDQIMDPQFALIVLVGIAAFATVYTIAVPLFSGDKLNARLKYVSNERTQLRRELLAELSKDQNATLRTKPKGLMAQVVDQFKLRKLFETDEMRAKLRMAGLRGQAPVVAFVFFRMVAPILVLLAALAYLFLVDSHGYPPLARFGIAFGLGFVGFYLPNVFVQNIIQRRQTSMKKSFPDALDLLLICVQSGLSIDAAFAKVANEIGGQSVEMAEEFTLTSAELSYLQDRRQAYENFGKRTGLAGVKAVSTSLIQAERYGTPLGQSLRVLAQESRDMRMAEAEKKAASLPPKLTVPMIVFFLPVLFLVILGPAAMKAMAVM